MPVPHLGWLHLMGLSPYADGWPWQMLVRHEGTATHPKGLAYVAQGAQGPRTYRFSAERARATSTRQPGAEGWVLYRQNLDGSEPRYYLSNAAAETPLETLAYVAGSRWSIETEFETGKSDVGMDELARCITISPCACWPAPSCWACSRLGGKKMPRITRPQVYRIVRETLPRPWFGPHELLTWLQAVQARNERARRSHQKRRAARQAQWQASHLKATL